ncbi:MAG: hypothetical protein NT172_21110 [Planctomycetota bacterium]|nr:hypothetical protein [Planctomycetota bacterium]
MVEFANTVNPFYASRKKRDATRNEACDRPVYARLPQAPRNGSPVPHLTSLYHFHRAGNYGDRKWPGNCGGNLIKDLLNYFQPTMVFDPMTGSGTARDVCEEMGVACFSFDIHDGFDACDPHEFPSESTFDFIWAHPPYWRQKLYADDPRDLSRAPSLEEFLRRYGQFIRNCARALRPRGGLCAFDLSHETSCVRGRVGAVLYRHHSIQPWCKQFQKGVPIVVYPGPARHLHDF